ncbi:MAG: rhodanese-like domain-containing protein [Flavobacteriaceae bacterium]|nr:rhodanese-like domain-containing protein [Muriicola sp.]NNC61076.1 rhodanese-like domain-containing protein [Eudoraea sp.]NNK20907.1 rhodanese-like domain-containing protein [Flavobacteriaceae bacterium]MBT8291164.1 rhodanese-like domain-containing protein [Muriicola sp.]NNK36363.1 rhodanese-like domain-containing protein [Eudoraea sp.]
MKNFLSFFVLLLLVTSCKNTNQLPITQFHQENLENYTLLDVRTPEEYEAGHLDNAININWYDADFTEKVGVLDKENTIYLYCKKGGRSAKAQAVLDSLGYRAVDLTGGYDMITVSDED